MQYRTMKSTGDKLSALGFGCMRLPEKNGKIDEERATRQIRYAIDHGVNYLDTAVPYHMGACEAFLGKALADGYREKVMLATKMPPWLVRSREDMDKILGQQLEKLRTDHIDYYLVHSMSGASWDKIRGLGFADFVEKAKAAGKIRHIGFSFHGGKDEFKRITDDYPWEFCQIQLNYLDEKSQAGVEGLEYAAAKGLGVIIMEPLRGGSLARTPPKEVREIWDKAVVNRTPAEWGLRWLWNRPEITVVLSGMNDERHIEENMRTVENALPGSLTAQELELIAKAGNAYRSVMKVGCTGCRYCMPCPRGVDIPTCFLVYNNKYTGGGAGSGAGGSKIEYIGTVGGVFSGKKPGYASQCIECKKCVKVCPQHLDIPAHLKEVKKEFEDFGFPARKFVLNTYVRYDRWRNMRKARAP